MTAATTGRRQLPTAWKATRAGLDQARAVARDRRRTGRCPSPSRRPCPAPVSTTQPTPRRRRGRTERVGELGAQLDRERVALLRAPQGDERDLAAPLDREQPGHGARCYPRSAAAASRRRGRVRRPCGDRPGSRRQARGACARDPDLAGEHPGRELAQHHLEAPLAAALGHRQPGLRASPLPRAAARHAPRVEPPSGGKPSSRRGRLDQLAALGREGVAEAREAPAAGARCRRSPRPSRRSSRARRARGRARSSARDVARARSARREARSCGPSARRARRRARRAGRRALGRRARRSAPGSPASPRRRLVTRRGGRRGRPRRARRRRGVGDEQRRQQRRVERLAALARREVHEQQAPVRLDQPVLRPGGDPEVLGLDRQRQPRPAPPARAGLPQRSHSARRVAITIALDPPSPTSRGISVRSSRAGAPTRRRPG